jgi:hypothetical protein
LDGCTKARSSKTKTRWSEVARTQFEEPASRSRWTEEVQLWAGLHSSGSSRRNKESKGRRPTFTRKADDDHQGDDGVLSGPTPELLALWEWLIGR